MNTTRIKILIIGGHRIMLRGLQSLAGEVVEGCQADTAASIDELAALTVANRYDLCIIDIDFPHGPDFDLLQRLRREFPAMKTIMSTSHEQPWYVKQFLDSGAEGIIFKSARPEEFADAIRRVLAGGTFQCMAARIMIKELPTQVFPSYRELQVLRELAQGFTTGDIARHLFISVNTVETHRRHLLEKFMTRNVVELLLKASRLGIITLP